jgi:hypothetical protein
MLVRRKMMLASLAGVLAPLVSLRAQPGPPPGEPPRNMAPGHEDHGDEHPRPRMPPPRHEERPRPPEGEGWRWREGHWSWDGRQWVWVSGRWYH